MEKKKVNMNGLEALENLRQNNIDDTHLFDDMLLNIIENDLKELEEIKNANNNETTKLTEQFSDRFLKGLNIYQLIFLMKISLDKKDIVPLILKEIENRIVKELYDRERR